MEDGHWAGDYGGPMFLLPGYAIATYVTQTEVPSENKQEIIRYLKNTQADDGGWGLYACFSFFFLELLGTLRISQLFLVQ